MDPEIKVLLVEDSPTDVLLIRHELQQVRGYRMELTAADRLDQAIARLGRELFDVVLLDLGLPDSNGADSFLRLQAAFPRIPIVVLTGTDDEAAGVEAIRLGVQDYLAKGPTDGKIIARSIRYAIQRKQAEAELQEKNAELAIANRELESFSYSVAHDLRNPLNGILACSALLEGPELNDEQHLAVGHMVQAAHRMSQIITDLLELSKITRQEVCRKPVDLSAMARQVMAQLQGFGCERRAVIDIDNGMFADADPGLAAILLENLLGNAWKYSSKNEEIRIRFGRHSSGDVRTAFFVQDNGVGFDGAKADRLFKPFHRLHAGTEFEGTGIGLAIAKNIVDKHNGSIWVESAPGLGATFFFTLG